MFNTSNIYKIEQVLSINETELLEYYSEKFPWKFGSRTDDSDSTRLFWTKDLWETEKCVELEQIFRNKIQSIFNIEIETCRLYLNGQAHGQCGVLHNDLFGGESDDYNYITVVYYMNRKWSPDKGGFTVIIDGEENTHIIYPNPNSAVIFNSRFSHVGLEPTIHCKEQRITLAYKFKVLK